MKVKRNPSDANEDGALLSVIEGVAVGVIFWHFGSLQRCAAQLIPGGDGAGEAAQAWPALGPSGSWTTPHKSAIRSATYQAAHER